MKEKTMKIKLDAYEQSIEDNAEKFIPVNETEEAEIESIIASANKTKNINIRISTFLDRPCR